jgi:hypothetical protein
MEVGRRGESERGEKREVKEGEGVEEKGEENGKGLGLQPPNLKSWHRHCRHPRIPTVVHEFMSTSANKNSRPTR